MLVTRLSLFHNLPTTFHDHPLIQVDVNKGRRGEGWGEAQRQKGERAIAYMLGTKEKERRGKEKVHKTRKV